MAEMIEPYREVMQKFEWRFVAKGRWFYDGTVPHQISIYAKPARFAFSRFGEDDRLDEGRPIPETKDGFLYFCVPGGKREHLTIDDAKAEANAKPWGPITWD